MNTDNNGQQPSADDAELAKVLEDINSSNVPVDSGQTASGLQFEETPIPDTTPVDPPLDEPQSSYGVASEVSLPAVDEPVFPAYDQPTPAIVDSPAISDDLESIKKNALEELRPLVDRLDLPANEKFDTLLLIIRSTDDKSLISSAYTAAKNIEDETKRAQALLDVIKEIDFFANQAK